MSKRRSMSDNEMLELLTQAFHQLSTDDSRNWIPDLFHVVNGSEQIVFDARQITIAQEEWKKYLEGLEKDYVVARKPFFGEGFSFREYDGAPPEEGVALHAKCIDDAVGPTAQCLIQAIANDDAEHGGKGVAENGLVISGQSNNGLRTLFVSAHTPFLSLKNRFWLFHDSTEYRPVDGEWLVLPKKIDAVFIGDDIWFLTLQGAQLFAPESICRAIAQRKVAGMKELPWIEGFGVLESEASKGFNPRRFLAFNEGKVSELGVPAKRKVIARKFGIPLTKTGNVNLSNPVSANSFIKVVCNKAMVDPFSDGPMEVSGAKTWIMR